MKQPKKKKIFKNLMVKKKLFFVLKWHKNPKLQFPSPYSPSPILLKYKRSCCTRPKSPRASEQCEALVAVLERLWSCPSFIWSVWATIAGKLQVKIARAESGDERREKTTDFHQNRLSNQMGTVRELGQSGWGGTVIGQISTQTRQSHQNKMDLLSTLLLGCHVILNGFK